MKTNWLIRGTAATLAAAAGTLAVAQTNPNQLIANRKGAMNLQAKYAGPLFAMARGAIPYDARIAQRNADYLVVLSQLPWDDFQPASIGIPNTRTKDDVLKDTEKFKRLAETLQGDALKVQAAVRGNDPSAMKSAAQAMGRTCNSCHESFATFDFRFRLE
jgi:cytochrome c556